MSCSTNRETTEEHKSFREFFESWLSQQDSDLQLLISACNEKQEEAALRALIQTVMDHYKSYYLKKSAWIKCDVLSVMNPSWRTSLEEAFLWIGGWRPSTVFHLLYSKSGLQLEDKLADLIRGISTGDLTDLSRAQFEQLDRLQMATTKEEQKITEKMAKKQETVADPPTVELSQAATELSGDDGGDEFEERIESNLASKECELVEVLGMADALRLRSLEEVVGILSPLQALHFLIAAAELQLRFHEWAQKREAVRARQQTGEAPPGDGTDARVSFP